MADKKTCRLSYFLPSCMYLRKYYINRKWFNRRFRAIKIMLILDVTDID